MINVHSQCSRTYYHDKPRCTAVKTSGYILHRYGELSAAKFHFLLPYCLFNSYCQLQYHQWNRNRLFEPVANFTEGDRFEWTATEWWFVMNNPNTRTLMPRVPQVATLLVNLGLGSEKPPWSKAILILSLRSLVHITFENEVPDENTMRCSHPWPFP